MKKGIILTATGIILMLATLILSSGNVPKRTFLGNIQAMELILVKGDYVEYFGLYEGRVAIPTRYPFILSLVVAIVGIAKILIDVTWKEENLKNTQASKSYICPHCGVSISASVSICPFCAENVKNTAPSSPVSAATVGNTVKSPEKEVVIEKTIEETPPFSGEPVKTKMRKLEALLADGIITQDDFNSRKQQIIDEYLNV